MTVRNPTIEIKKVGVSKDPLCVKTRRGIFTFDSFLDYISQSFDYIDKKAHRLTINLSRVGWLTLSDWWAFTSILHGQIENAPDLRIELDFVGQERDLISYRECKEYLTGKIAAPRFSDDVYNNSYSVHRVLNFVKSLEGPTGFENVARGRIVLARQSLAEAGKPGWYRKDPDVENSIILSRTNVEEEEMCIEFVNRSQIEMWREAMATKRVPNAAVFQSSEFWRVLCHELARNVVEHANGPGFIAGRVVLPKARKWPPWCSGVYGNHILEQLRFTQQHGFVELCVSDSGVGIPMTLEASYKSRYLERHGKTFSGSPTDEDLLKFAFDELGTSKDFDHSWITDRHALGHILLILEKYGGILSIRSKNAALLYCTGKNKLRRCTTQMGFESQESFNVSPAIPGTHLQLLIPLTPPSSSGPPLGVVPHLACPPSFHIDFKHPVGPLVPLRDKLEALSTSIKGSPAFMFKEATKALAQELLHGSHPRSQMLVFDFSELDWVPAQFETFMYLMQNVFLNRLVLFTQVGSEFAQLVNSQEDEELPTYLPDTMREDIDERILDREFTEGTFLETYSALGAIVLGLGPDQGEYLFGVRGSQLRNALLELINNEEQSIQGLCKAHMLDPNLLSAVLHRASKLFEQDKFKRWRSVFVRGEPDRDDLETQRLRAITKHFDVVANHCSVWRGKSNERFYLPSEDAVYKKFFESSRILARERYVLEVAERLVYRICYGLGSSPFKELTLNDIDILACSTTPTVMLAEAVRRAWLVGQQLEKKPVVIDYGPSLFSGADPARILNAKNGNLRAIILQDVFDEGKLTKRLVTLAEKQGVKVLFVISFIRFLNPSECIDNRTMTYGPEAFWGDNHPTVGKRVHAMIGLPRPDKTPKRSINNWGVGNNNLDYVIDPRSLRPVPLKSLRFESRYTEERSLTKRDSHLKELDLDGDNCRLAAGHFVYGHRHFAVMVDIRGVLTGAIGHKIIAWLADICCDSKDRDVHWEESRGRALDGEISAILLPLHSQIHYLLPGLQIELAQRGVRVPHFFLDATSFGGGVETYDIPYQLQDQIFNAAKNIRREMDGGGTDNEKRIRAKAKQLRLIFIDDAIFSARTIMTVLNSIAKHVDFITEKVYGENTKYQGPIEWIRAFAVLNQLPVARSVLWHELSTCSASSAFHFDEYAPFIGVATFSADDCPACKKLGHLEHLEHRIGDVGPIHATEWIRERRDGLTALSTEAPSFRKTPSLALPDPIDVLALPKGAAPEAYKPIHADSAIWRFYELMYLSYPLSDVLKCLQSTRNSGLNHVVVREEYARFRLAVYDWCIQNWHQVHLYQAEDQMLDELRLEVQNDESIFVEVIYRLSSIIRTETVLVFVKWAIDKLAEQDADRRNAATETTLNLDTALTLLFFALHEAELNETGILSYLNHKQAGMIRKSNFLSILYFRLTRPRVADPRWALNTIAETCFRGRFGNTLEERRTTDHELLGRLASETARNPRNEELRRRLEGSLINFIDAVENIQPYFDADLLAPVVLAAKNVREWLRLPPREALKNTTPLAELNSSMRYNSETWGRFAKLCHMPASEFEKLLKGRLKELRELSVNEPATPYNSLKLEVDVNPEVKEWCLMTHIPRLINCISNIALEPARRVAPSFPSQIFVKRCAPEKPQALIVEVFTYFGSSTESLNMIKKSAKISRSFEDLQHFNIKVDGPVPDSSFCADGLRFSMLVPVGFQT